MNGIKNKITYDKTMKINNKFELRQVVYLKTDVDQSPRLVTSIRIDSTGLIYQISCGTQTSDHFDFEISEIKNIVLTTEN